MTPLFRHLLRWAFAAFAFSLVGSTAEASFTASGRFLYRDRAFSFNGGFSGAEPDLPIRLATVQVQIAQTGQLLATGVTDENGDVSLFVPTSGSGDIVVRCFSRSNQFGASPLRITNGVGIEYSVTSQVFTNWDFNTNLAFGSVTALKTFNGSSQGGPFNLLDMLVASVQYVKSLGAPNPSATLRAVWPAGGSFTSGNVANLESDDGFDDLVQLHEIGHVIHNHYSDNDQPGAAHTFGQSDQDPRLSFGEGWATCFAGAVRRFRGLPDPGIYLDCSGSGLLGPQSIQLHMALETGFPFTAETGGEADEGAIFCALWDIIDRPIGDDDPLNSSITFPGNLTGERVLWSVMTGPVKTAVELTVRDLWNGFFFPTNYGQHPSFLQTFQAWGLHFTEDANEPNGTPAQATPIALSSNWSATQTLYDATANPPAPGGGDLDYFTFTGNHGSVVEVETRYPGGLSDAGTYCDPHLELIRPDGSLLNSDEDSGVGRNALFAQQVLDQTGTWTIRVSSTHPYRRTGSYELRAELISPTACQNSAAAVVTGVGARFAGGTPTLTADLPKIPSPTFTISISNAPASSPGSLLIGTKSIDVPFDAGHIYVSPVLTLPIQSDATGQLKFASPLTAPSLCGAVIHLQAFFPGAPGAIGLFQTAQTPRLTLTIGN